MGFWNRWGWGSGEESTRKHQKIPTTSSSRVVYIPKFQRFQVKNRTKLAECVCGGFGRGGFCILLPFLGSRHDVLAKPFVLFKNWNFGTSTAYPQAKLLILKAKMTIPEKIPIWNKPYKLGIFVVLTFILGWNKLECGEVKVILRKTEKELFPFLFQRFQTNSKLAGTWNTRLESLESGWRMYCHPDALIKLLAMRIARRGGHSPAA